jgi:hypothetical protein
MDIGILDTKALSLRKLEMWQPISYEIGIV